MINELLRRFKGSYALYNLLKANELQHIKQQYDKLGLKKKYYICIMNQIEKFEKLCTQIFFHKGTFNFPFDGIQHNGKFEI